MPSISPTYRIYGTKEAITKAGNIRPAALRSMRAAAVRRANESVTRYRTEMTAEYRSPWATGSIARSIKAKVRNEADGVSVSFTANSGARNHIEFLTNILPNSHFLQAPFVIGPMPPGKVMAIRAPGHVRKFIQNPVTGRMGGSKPGIWRVAKQVTVGFKRDVLAEVTQSEGESFVADMTAAVANGIGEATK